MNAAAAAARPVSFQQPNLPAAPRPMGPGQATPRPMNPAAPRQFGMMNRPMQPRPVMPMAQNRPPPPRPMAPRAPARPSMAGASSMGGAMLSDRQSKQRIKELEDLNDTYAALLDTPAATSNVKPPPPPTADLDRSNARALADAGSYSYEYKNPSAPGATAGRQAGPMADELRGIPGVVRPGADGFDRVDTGRLALATASATGDQERRLRELEDEYDALSETQPDDDAERLGSYFRRGR